MKRAIRKWIQFDLLGLALLLSALVLNINGQGARQLSQTSPNASEKRTALVIGNADYQHARKLANPVNDATDMTRILQELGFEVISGTDLSLKQMNEKVRSFGDALRTKGGVGLFFYAGHGIQVGGRNYLIPVDADIPREDEIDYNALNLDAVLRKLDTANNGLNIVILDACRNNPFARSWSRSADTGGLAQISAPTGTFIAYATSPDRTASDGEGRNGLYTSQMLRIIRQPNLKIEETFKEIRKAVDAASGGKQIPWDSSSLRGEFYFSGGKAAIASETPIPSRIQVEPSNGERLPSADDVLLSFARAIGGEQVKKISTLVLIGVIDTEVNGQRATCPIEYYWKAPDKSLRLIKFPNDEILGEVFNGNRGWKASTGKAIEELPAAEVESNKRSNALAFGDIAMLRTLYSTISIVGKQKVSDREFFVLKLKTRDGQTEHTYFNPTTGLLERWQYTDSSNTQSGITYTVDSDYEDYQSVNGLRVPMTIRQRAPGIAITIKFNVFQTKFNVPLDDKLFIGK